MANVAQPTHILCGPNRILEQGGKHLDDSVLLRQNGRHVT
jgi:hypothetical protein